ncbi:unnamed protein product [Blepharisma stoltei]|uniref:Aminotransferase-like plant mobile domain-containing protein n=1 Tax=Blepharisma stoltei TaxID=1481888 RepID=A0AAU9K0T6_9CILI|nr:unnamed protein product [Blepharisma stoltei]
MGKKQSKDQSMEAPPEPDNRVVLTRGFGPKYQEAAAKWHELRTKPLEQQMPRPIHSSGYWRDLPQMQSWFAWGMIWFQVFRKLPFTNPMVRVMFFVIGLDCWRARQDYWTILSQDDLNEIRQFDLMYHYLFKRRPARMPNYTDEWEDWYEMNKPAYRVPVPHEYSLDSWMRFFALNRKKYGLRDTQWHGEWEQEMCLNMDLHAPHADHWLEVH